MKPPHIGARLETKEYEQPCTFLRICDEDGNFWWVADGKGNELRVKKDTFKNTMMKNEDLILKAQNYAMKCHKDVNQYYGRGENRKPYYFHLEMVVEVANLFSHLIPSTKFPVVIAGCWGHDLIEDARQTYNDVREALGDEVAKLVYALTNEKGKNRSERANSKYYEGIRDTEHATFIKICDRIANVKYSASVGSGMLKMYAKENSEFKQKLYNPKYDDMFDYLNGLFGEDKN